MELTNEFKKYLFEVSPEDSEILLLEIGHPILNDKLRIVAWNCDVVFEGKTYVACPFEFDHHSDVENEIPKARLVISNIGKPLMRWIEVSIGGKDAEIRAITTLASNPDLDPQVVKLTVASCSVTLETITFDLTIQSNFSKRGTKLIFDPLTAPGIY